MKAIVYHEYGSPDVLRIEEIDKPVPKDDEVLIKVRAASLNPLDWRLLKGKPLAVRVMAKLTKLNTGIPGVDVAGVVEAVGRKVTEFKAGDEVFGSARSACAEYACPRASKVAMKPESATFEQAASVNVAGITALQGLRAAKIQPDNKVLVNGAAGGVGTFAVQIAKSFGAEVTGVCSTRNLEMVRSIGADAVIDYTQEDFTKRDRRFDLILECVGNHSFSECKRVLNPNGRYVGVGAPHDGSLTLLLARLIKDLLLSVLSSRKQVMFMAKSSQKDLTVLGELITNEKLTPVIDRRYALSEVPDALRYLEQGHAQGKVIIDVSEDNV